MDYANLAQKLSEARRELMLPHSRGEAESIAGAFSVLSQVLAPGSRALRDMQNDDLDDNATDWVREIQELMDTSGIQDPSGRGRGLIKAGAFTNDQKLALSRAVDELANWFRRRS